jgi:hypothetical protein
MPGPGQAAGPALAVGDQIDQAVHTPWRGRQRAAERYQQRWLVLQRALTADLHGRPVVPVAIRAGPERVVLDVIGLSCAVLVEGSPSSRA